MSLSRARKSGITQSTSPTKSRSLQATSGIPGPIRNLSGTGIANGQINLTWTSPEIIGDSAITSYEVVSIPAGGSASVSGTSAVVTGLSTNTSYQFDVRAVNAVGKGVVGRGGNASTTNWNEATGGSVATVTNYLGSGQTWKVHTFTGNATFTVTNAGNPFKVFLVSGGAPGGGPGAGGRGGKGLSNDNVTLSSQSYSVVVGGSNTATTFAGLSSANGALTGGAGGASGSYGSDSPGQAGSAGFSTTISGSTVFYSGGGGGGGSSEVPGALPQPGGAGGNRGGGNGGACDHASPSPGAAGAANTGGGGGGGGRSGGGAVWSAAGGAGGSGIAIVAYRIS